MMLHSHAPGPLPAMVILALVDTLVILGQAPVMDPSISSLIGNLGVIGVLVWHLWYHTTNSYPKMLERFSIEAEKMRSTFEREQDAQRKEHATELAEMRNMLIETMRGFRTAVHDVKDTANQAIMTQAAANIPR